MRATDLLSGALLPGTDPAAAEPRGTAMLQQGLAEIRNHDPGFDEAEFKAHAQAAFSKVQHGWSSGDISELRQVMAGGIWRQHRQQLDELRGRGGRHETDARLVDCDIVAAGSNGTTDTVVVRLQAEGKDLDRGADGKVLRGSDKGGSWAEEWAFQRAASASTTHTGLRANRCPSCGAPLQVDQEGLCAYCRQQVMEGRFDWVLTRVRPAKPPAPQWASGGDLASMVGAGSPVVSIDMSGAAKTAKRGIGCITGTILLVVLLGVGGGIYAAVQGTRSVSDAIKSVTDTIPGVSIPGVAVPGVPGAAGGGPRVGSTFVRTPGVLKLSGALNQEVPFQAITEAIGDKTCATIANAARGATVSIELADKRRIVVSGQFRAQTGSAQGPGVYETAKKTLFANVNLIDPDGIEKNGQQWHDGLVKVPAGVAATVELRPDGSGALSFTNLKPRQPNGLPGDLSATASWSCYEIGQPVPG